MRYRRLAVSGSICALLILLCVTLPAFAQGDAPTASDQPLTVPARAGEALSGWRSLVDYFTTRAFLGNELWRYGLLALWILVGLVAGRILRYIAESAGERMQKAGKRPVTSIFLQCLAKPFMLFGFSLGLYLGLLSLKPSPAVAEFGDMAIRTLFAIAVGYAVYRLVDILDHYLGNWAKSTDSKLDDMLVPLVRKSLRITVVIIVLMFVVEQIAGAERITTLLAGLGVGGLAVALAAQDTIKNFFGSLMILLDKPFQIGDRIIMGGHDGPVEEVGFRSTKVRTLDGHLVSIPNSIVVNEMVQNIGKRPFIKRVMNVTITYDTPTEKITRAVEILREILDNHDGMNPELPPRVYFNDFNADSLNILVLYWYHPPDYWAYLEFSQKVNLQIFERFEKEGIEFAFPTQTLYLANDEKRQLALRMLDGGTSDAGKRTG